MKKKAIQYLTSKIDLWFIGMVWNHPLAGMYLFNLMKAEKFETPGHLFAQRGKSIESPANQIFIQFLKDGGTLITPETFPGASLEKLMEQLERAFDYCEKFLLVRERKEKVVSVEKTAEPMVVQEASEIIEDPNDPEYWQRMFTEKTPQTQQWAKNLANFKFTNVHRPRPFA